MERLMLPVHLGHLAEVVSKCIIKSIEFGTGAVFPE
jgi:hypothetical protein